MRKAPQAGEIWKHFKGNLYEIVCLAINEKTLKPVVIYKEYNTEIYWSRDLLDFLSQDDRAKDQEGFRFIKVDK